MVCLEKLSAQEHPDFARMLLGTPLRTGKAVGCPVPLLTHLGQGLLKEKDFSKILCSIYPT